MEERMSVREYLMKSPLGFSAAPLGNMKEVTDCSHGGKGNLARSIGRDIPTPLHFWLKRKGYKPVRLSRVCESGCPTYLQRVRNCSCLVARALVVENLRQVAFLDRFGQRMFVASCNEITRAVLK